MPLTNLCISCAKDLEHKTRIQFIPPRPLGSPYGICSTCRFPMSLRFSSKKNCKVWFCDYCDGKKKAQKFRSKKKSMWVQPLLQSVASSTALSRKRSLMSVPWVCPQCFAHLGKERTPQEEALKLLAAHRASVHGAPNLARS